MLQILKEVAPPLANVQLLESMALIQSPYFPTRPASTVMSYSNKSIKKYANNSGRSVHAGASVQRPHTVTSEMPSTHSTVALAPTVEAESLANDGHGSLHKQSGVVPGSASYVPPDDLEMETLRLQALKSLTSGATRKVS